MGSKMTTVQAIDKIMKFHRRKSTEGSDCIEVENKMFVPLTDSFCFNENGDKWVEPKKEVIKRMREEKCHFCEFLRKLREKCE